MAVRFLIADRHNKIIGELEPDIGPVSWRLNNVGRVNFSLAMTDEKAIEDYLKFGNRVLMEFDNGLPEWGGVIDPSRDWKDGRIECTAYSGEYVFGTRITDRGRYFTSASVGYIFEQLIIEANAESDMGITVGSAWTGGDPHSPSYHFKDLLTIFVESLTKRLSDTDFEVMAEESGGAIAFTAHLYERKGSDKPGVVLMEDHNLAKIRLLEQGTIVNSWDLAGEGDDWGADRLTSHEEDANSIAEYGLRQDSKIYADVSKQDTLDTHAVNLLAQSKDPHNMLELEVVNLAPASFADYEVGDSVRVMLHSYGFGGLDAMVRVLTREYDPGRGTCKLVVREE